MAISSQGGGSTVSPIGMSKKKRRYAPIIQEQARQGIATRSVADAKAREQQEKEWEFTKASREAELAMQEKSLGLQEKYNAHKKTMDYIGLGLSGLSTAVEIWDAIF